MTDNHPKRRVPSIFVIIPEQNYLLSRHCIHRTLHSFFIQQSLITSESDLCLDSGNEETKILWLLILHKLVLFKVAVFTMG